MPLAYAQNKIHIYKWRSKNIEKHNKQSNAAKNKRRILNNELKRFLNILLD